MNNFENVKTVLTMCAHPDDETLAAGATLSKLSRLGKEIHVAIPATGMMSRSHQHSEQELSALLAELREDTLKAVGHFGVKKEHLYFGEFPDNAMDSVPLLRVIQWMEGIIEQVKPDLIITHHRNCTNIDHQICHQAVVVASRPKPNRKINVLCGEVPSSTGYLKPTSWEPNLFVEVTPEDIEAKKASLSSFKTEVQDFPHPRSLEVIDALAKIRGSESGAMNAEAFMIQKIFFN